MKKALILTSIFALAACSGGGHHHAPAGPDAPVRPAVTIQGFSGGTTVNANNADLTNMSSYTVDYATDENTSKQAMIDYVNSRLAGVRGNTSRAASLNRAATNRAGGITRVDDTEFADADAAIAEMKSVLHDMVLMGDNADSLNRYVGRYREAVVRALLLANQSVATDASVADLVAAFNTFKETNGTTADNVMAQLDHFDQEQFGISKTRMENDVKLRDTGMDAYFKFKLDDGGRIESISLWENPTDDYGSSWSNKKIVIDDNGDVVAVTSTDLNPFDADYLNSDAGDLIRDGNSFTNTLNHYTFDLGEYADGGFLEDDIFSEVAISNVGERLTLDQAKQKLKDYIIAKVNNKLHNQNGGEIQADLDAAVVAMNHYMDAIDNLTADAVTAAFDGTFTQTANMDGVGKDVGLKYSDFGYATMVTDMGEHGTETQYLTYVGGYEHRRMDIDNNSLESGATFTGTGIVTVEDEHKDKNNHSNDTFAAALYKDTGAQLVYTVDGGIATHTLTMNNLKAYQGASADSDWYKMEVSGTEGNPNVVMKFNADGKTIDDTYKFFKVTGSSVSRDQDVVATNGTAVSIDMTDGTAPDAPYNNNYRLHGNASAEYYGQDPANPTEATAGFTMSERYHSNDNNVQHELSIYGAFGGQKD